MEAIIKTVLFYSFSSAAVISAVFVVVKKNPVTSAMNLIVTFFSISGIYVIINSQFIAVMQVLVYAGAITVLILFVIMLLNLHPSDIQQKNNIVPRALLAVFMVTLMALSLVTIVLYGQFSGDKGGITSQVLSEKGSVQIIARSMFSKYLLPFELVSLLLTVAIIGVVILSRGGLKDKKEGGR